MSEDSDPKTSHEAKSLIIAVSDFDFLIGLCILKVILLNTHSLNKYLQGKNVDVRSAYNNAKASISVLEKCRSEDNFNLVWQQANVLAEEVTSILRDTDFEFKAAHLPRTKPSKRVQALSGEVTGEGDRIDNIQQHYKINCFYVAFDSVLLEMNNRFNDGDQSVLTGLSSIIFDAIPSNECFDTISQIYGLDKDLLRVDYNILQHFKSGLSNVNSASDLYGQLFSSGILEMMPEMQKVLRIFASIPATSCSAERSFSTLRRIKTYTRNRIGQDRLSNIAILNIERTYANNVLREDLDEVVDTFARKSSNRIRLFF